MRRFAWLVLVVLGVGVGAAPAFSRPARLTRAAHAITTNARVSYPTMPAGLEPAATLRVSASDRPLQFEDVGGSSQTIAALGYDPQGLFAPDGIYVFTKPSKDWSSSTTPPAHLTPANGEPLGQLAASDRTVVGAAPEATDGVDTDYVFTRPSGGWSGSLHESATLARPVSGSGGRALVAISGGTVFTADGDVIYAFNQPPGGWSGNLQPSATLSMSTGGAAIDSMAVSRGTLVARTRTGQTIYVFTRPSKGWSGRLHPTTTLPLSGTGVSSSLGISGRTIVTAGPLVGADAYQAVYVAQAPPRGWTAHSKPAVASIHISGDVNNLGPTVAISGDIAAFVTASPQEHECPCGEQIYALTQPGTWSGTTRARPSAHLSNTPAAPAFLLDGQTLATSADDGIAIFTVARPPTISKPSLTGLSTSKPKLELTATQTAGGQPIKSLTLHTPAALQLKRPGRVKTAGGGQTKISVKRNSLTVTLTKPESHLTVAIANGALTTSRGLTKILKHKPKRSTKLRVVAHVLDAKGSLATANITFTIS
jgi:hypothetical protein